KINRAREAVKILSPITALGSKGAEDPIVAPGIIVHIGAAEINTGVSQTLAGLISDPILAGSDGLIGGETAIWTAISLAPAVTVVVAWRRAVKSAVLLARRSSEGTA